MKTSPSWRLWAPLVLCLASLFLFAGRKAPENPESQLSFGVEMARRGLWNEALFRFKQAARQEPGNPRILNNMAVAYEALGQFDQALEAYKEAIKADPNNKDLKRNYSRFVEFYRNFKPDDQKSSSSSASSESTPTEVAQDGR